MKKYVLFCQLMLISMAETPAQFSVGENALSIQSGTNFFVDGLVLNPSTDLSLSSQSLTLSSIAAPGSPPGISRVYHFSSSFTFSGTAGIYYDEDELNGNTESALQIAYGNPLYTETTSSTVDAAANYISSPLTGVVLNRITAATLGALPVSLAYFAVKSAENGHLLTWETSFEFNSDFFEVQRSTDMKTWEYLAEIKSLQNSHKSEQYQFTDIHPQEGINYYRLRLVDLDGSYTFSHIRSIVNEGVLAIKAYPNPTFQKLEVIVADWQNVQRIQVLDLQGREWYKSEKSSHVNLINTISFIPGTYLVHITYFDNTHKTVKVVKQ